MHAVRSPALQQRHVPQRRFRWFFDQVGVSGVGKPYEGEPHVRFDEGAMETGRRPARLGHSPKGEKRSGVAGPHAIPRHCSTLQKRNIAEALPERLRARTRAMSQAYATADPKRARQLLGHLARTLEREYPSAAASLREGLEETLTIMRMDLPEGHTRMLSSTNLIENLFSRVRDMAGRVRRWQGDEMILRWTAAGVLEAERNFREIAGFRGLTKLDAALRAHDATLDNRKQAA